MPKKEECVIETKLDVIIKLLAANLCGDKTQTDSILVLSKLGLDRNTIAEIIGTKPSTVSVRLSEAKKKN